MMPPALDPPGLLVKIKKKLGESDIFWGKKRHVDTDSWGGVNASRPIGTGEPLIMPESGVGVQYHRGSLGCIAIFVGVGRDAGHPGHPKIEWGQIEARFLHKRNQKST